MRVDYLRVFADAYRVAGNRWSEDAAHVDHAQEFGPRHRIFKFARASVGVAAMIWMANATSNSGTQSSAQDRQSEYINAKRFCDTPPPSGSNECSTLSRQIDHAERCIKLYEAWDQKWLPGRHDEKIVGWKNRLQNLKDEHNGSAPKNVLKRAVEIGLR